MVEVVKVKTTEGKQGKPKKSETARFREVLVSLKGDLAAPGLTA